MFKLKLMRSCTKRIILRCKFFRPIWILMKIRIASNSSFANLQGCCNSRDQSWTGWNWANSNFSGRYNFSGFGIVFIWIQNNRGFLCLFLVTSIVLWFFSTNFFAEQWLIWLCFVIFAISRSISSDVCVISLGIFFILDITSKLYWSRLRYFGRASSVLIKNGIISCLEECFAKVSEQFRSNVFQLTWYLNRRTFPKTENIVYFVVFLQRLKQLLRKKCTIKMLVLKLNLIKSSGVE